MSCIDRDGNAWERCQVCDKLVSYPKMIHDECIRIKVTDRELMECVGSGGCRVWDPDNQPSVPAKLEQDPHAYDDHMIMMARTGYYAYGMPLYTELLLCIEHTKKVMQRDDQ